MRDTTTPSWNDPPTREPLPAMFEPELVELDALIARQANEQVVPPDVSESVFLNSRGHLPQPAVIASRPSRADWSLPRAMRSLWGGRLAMAASLGLTVGMAMWFVHANSLSRSTPSPVVMAVAVAEIELADALDYWSAIPLRSDIESNAEDGVHARTLNALWMTRSEALDDMTDGVSLLEM